MERANLTGVATVKFSTQSSFEARSLAEFLLLNHGGPPFVHLENGNNNISYT